MHRQTLSISVREIPGRGTGLAVTAPVAEKTPLMLVPKDLILSLEQVWVHAKGDYNIKAVPHDIILIPSD